MNWTKYHLNWPGPTRRSSVKDVLVLFCYILTSRLFKLDNRFFIRNRGIF